MTYGLSLAGLTSRVARKSRYCNCAAGSLGEFDHLDISGSTEGIADKDIFDEEVVDGGTIVN